jgi:hypothetical protein
LRSFRLLPLTFLESELSSAVQHRLNEELAAIWCWHDQPFPLPCSVNERIRHIPDATRLAAADRVRNVLSGLVRCEFVDLVSGLVAQAHSEGSAVSAINAALEGIRQLIASCREKQQQPPALLPKDEAYAAAMRSALQDRLSAIVPVQAARISQGILAWVMQSLGPGRVGTPPCLDVLSSLPTRASTWVQAEAQRILADLHVVPWILPAMGDGKHAVLCWRDFLNQSEPLPLAAGGQRRLMLVTPESPSSQLLCEMLDTAFSEPAAAVVNPSPVVWLLQEAQQIPAVNFADDLVGHLDLVKQAASRLHTRIDVSWSDPGGGVSA